MNTKWNSLREWLNKESIQFNNKHPLTDVIYQMDIIEREYWGMQETATRDNIAKKVMRVVYEEEEVPDFLPRSVVDKMYEDLAMMYGDVSCSRCHHYKAPIKECRVWKKPIANLCLHDGGCLKWQSADTSFTNKARPEHGDHTNLWASHEELAAHVAELENSVKRLSDDSNKLWKWLKLGFKDLLANREKP